MGIAVASTAAARGRHDTSLERVVLVAVSTRDQDPRTTMQHLEELGRLADSAGAVVAGTLVQNRPQFDPATLLGSGKVKELAELCQSCGADKIIFDDDLSPAQAKRLEEMTERFILDRSGLILDIFARQARTREAKLQVEIAQLEYLIPRLTRMWTHLERQGGGVGTLGPGETQLETDRRLARTRLAKLRRELSNLETGRSEQGKRRRGDAFCVALAGYTNAGKSTLLNALTGAKVLAQDRLFSTLDATTRRLWVGDGLPECTLSDTVGFIRKLPHHLVASFRSTLRVVAEADLVLHLVDASGGLVDEEMRVASSLLDELVGDQTTRQVVFNKIDRLDSPAREALAAHFPHALSLSAATREGFDAVRQAIGQHARSWIEARRSKARRELEQAVEHLDWLE